MECHIKLVPEGSWDSGEKVILSKISVGIYRRNGDLRQHIKVDLSKKKILEIVADTLDDPRGEVSLIFPDVTLLIEGEEEL